MSNDHNDYKNEKAIIREKRGYNYNNSLDFKTLALHVTYIKKNEGKEAVASTAWFFKKNFISSRSTIYQTADACQNSNNTWMVVP